MFKKIVNITLWVLIFCSIASVSTLAYSFLCSNGLKKRPLKFTSNSGFMAESRWAIDYATRQWNNKTNTTTFMHNATQTSQNSYPLEEKNGVNLISRVDMGYYNNWVMSARCYLENNHIVEADINVNIYHPFANNGMPQFYDVQNILTHELGHALGLDHSTNTEATMYGSAERGETKKRDLHTDDLNGYWAIYG